MNELVERLRARGWRMTPQRQAIALVLEGENVHLSAEAVVTRAREAFPEISMATVYNTLNELVAMGEILEVSTGSGTKRFDSNTSRAHHHLVCTSCGELHDVHADFDGPTLKAREQHGFFVTGFNVVFNGLCPSCQKLTGTSH
ncbi:MAG TPA: Fur family transcriptional regulator [Acidimicrobiales bacterium]|nr:Fur family transcriptional regulator [Acidimicrobiales bacterium]